MKYFIFKKRGEFKKGDKVKILIRKFDESKNKYIEELLEEFVLEEFEYYPEHNLYVLNSPAKFNQKELQQKIENGEIIAETTKE